MRSSLPEPPTAPAGGLQLPSFPGRGVGPDAIQRRFEAGVQGLQLQRLCVATPGSGELLCRDLSLVLEPGGWVGGCGWPGEWVGGCEGVWADDDDDGTGCGLMQPCRGSWGRVVCVVGQ